jgi:hypothetical protein
MDAKIIARFWAKVDKRGPEDCWLWTAHRCEWGYGTFNTGPRMMKAHRVAFELANGPIPTGLCVCHRCDVPACVNPAHLFLGTNSDNVADKVAKGRQARTIGESHPMVKLTEAIVFDLRADRAGGMTYRKLAAKYAISLRQAHRIARGKSWAHL